MPATKITRKWQVTVPLEVREGLDVDAGDRLMVNSETGDVRVERQAGLGDRLATLFACYSNNLPSADPDTLLDIARSRVAKAQLHELRETQ